MKAELRERREETYRMLYRHGVDHAEVVSRLSDRYGVSESAIRKDINRMSSWIRDIKPDLGEGVLRLAKIRDQHQELELLAIRARQEGDIDAERRAREAVVRTLEAQARMAERLELTGDDEEEAWAEPIETGLSLTQEAFVDEWSGVATEPTYLTDDGELVRVDADGDVYDEDDELIGEAGDEDLLPGDEHRGPLRDDE